MKNMNVENESYVIYKAENKENGFVYIGATSRSIEERKKDHIQKSYNETGHYFQEAIASYGEDAFVWEQIDTAESSNELASKEKEYILEYKSNDTSYNTDGGGGFKKDVYQYNLDGTHNHTYKDLESAANAVNATIKKISKTCLSVNQLLDGYYWSYEFVDTYIPNIDKRRKEVLQIDLEGFIIAQFKSVAEASRQTGISKSPIAKTCREEQDQTGGYLWKYCN
jgi:group I intron endonuclease